MNNRVKTYIVVARDSKGDYSTDYVQALSAQQAVDTLYSAVRAEYEILTVAVVVKNWK
jgi:hypothetical protein